MRIWLTIFIILGSISAHAKERDNIDTIAPKIEATLKVGDSSEVIEQFLKNTLWQYSFDKYQSRYQAIASEETSECINRSLLLWLFYDCAIQIYLNVDENGNYSGYKLEQTYSGL